jgi:hypothetical protein
MTPAMCFPQPHQVVLSILRQPGSQTPGHVARSGRATISRRLQGGWYQLTTCVAGGFLAHIVCLVRGSKKGLVGACGVERRDALFRCPYGSPCVRIGDGLYRELRRGVAGCGCVQVGLCRNANEDGPWPLYILPSYPGKEHFTRTSAAFFFAFAKRVLQLRRT